MLQVIINKNKINCRIIRSHIIILNDLDRRYHSVIFKMALDAICGLPQRSKYMNGSGGGIRNGLPPVADFERDFESLQLSENEELDPMQIPRPPFVSYICLLKIIF